jgi:hypothetical protein
MKEIKLLLIVSVLIFPFSMCTSERNFSQEEEEIFSQADENGKRVNEGYDRCRKYLEADCTLTSSPLPPSVRIQGVTI